MPLRTPKRLRKVSISHERAPHQERAVAKRIGGKCISGSGSGMEKGDVRKRGVVRVECKTTKHQSFRVTREMLTKIEDAAVGAGEMPVISIDFINERGKVMQSCCVVPEYILDQLADYEKDSKTD